MKIPAMMALLSHVATHGCATLPTEKWVQVLLLRQTVPLVVKFKEGCDLEGTVNLGMTPFPLDLAVRNIPDADRVKGVVTPEIDPRLMDKEIDVTLKMDNAKLLGKKGAELVAFSSVVKMVSGLDGKSKSPPVCKVHITRYKGKKADVVQTIQFH